MALKTQKQPEKAPEFSNEWKNRLKNGVSENFYKVKTNFWTLQIFKEKSTKQEIKFMDCVLHYKTK